MGIKEYFKSLEEAGDAAIKAADDAMKQADEAIKGMSGNDPEEAEKVEETVSAAIEDAQTATGTFVGKLKRWFWEILGL